MATNTFDRAVRMFVTSTDTLPFANDTSEGVGSRGSFLVRQSLRGAVTNFMNSFWTSPHISNYDIARNERYKQRFLYDMLQGTQVPYLDKMASEEVEDFMARAGKATFKFFPLLVDILTQNYTDPPTRRFLNDDNKPIDKSQAQMVGRMLVDSGFDNIMSVVDRYRYVFGHCLIRPLYVNKKLRWAVHAPCDYSLLVEADPETQQNDIKAIVFVEPYDYQTNEGSILVNEVRYRHKVWTAEEYGVFEGGRQILREPNKYGEIPYVYCTKDLNYGERFRQPDMYDEANAQIEINNLCSLSGWHVRFIGLPVTVFTDAQNVPESDLKARPGHVLTLASMDERRNATFQFVSPKDSTQSFSAKIEECIDLMMRSHGVNTVTKEGIKAGTSGLTVEVSMAPVISELKKSGCVTEILENEIYEKLRLVTETDTDDALPEVRRIDVDYAYNVSMRARADQRAEAEMLLRNGLVGRAEALRMLFPNRYDSDEEAEEALPDEEEVMLNKGMDPNPQQSGPGATDPREKAGGAEFTNGRPNAGRSE